MDPLRDNSPKFSMESTGIVTNVDLNIMGRIVNSLLSEVLSLE